MKRLAGLMSLLAEPFLPVSKEDRIRRWKRIGLVCGSALVLWLLLFLVVRSWAALTPEPAPARWFHEPATKEGIAVLVHGWTKGPDDMEEVAEVVQEVDDKLAIRLWSYDARRFSNLDPAGLAQTLELDINRLHEETGGRVVLIGHSLGGLLVRRAYLDGLELGRDWARSVKRILLFAAPNRGTRATSRSSSLAVGDALARSCGVGELIQATYRGAPFVVNLRIDWIRTFRTLPMPPLVAQVLGNRDHVVSAADSRDLLQFPNSEDRILPNSTHASVVRRAESGEILRDLLTRRAAPEVHAAPDTAGIDYKVLIVHGIRDYGDRFEELRDAVASLAIQNGFQPQTSAPRYQYFSALQFLNPFSRRLKLYEFADMYAELLATPPIDAPIHFAGHSFGTYLMGRSLLEYPSIRFERVYLAGSVLHETFFSSATLEHSKLLGDQIQWLRNDIATADWPVGILCSGIDGLGLAEHVGTGGFNGFASVARGDRFDQRRYYPGGHGKALERENHASIAHWLVAPLADGNPGLRRDPTGTFLLVSSRSHAWSLASRAAPALFLLILGSALYLLLFGRRPWISAAAILAVMWLLDLV